MRKFVANQRIKEEHGTVLLTTLFSIICLFGFLSLLLLSSQTDLLGMRTQQTADLITKGAKAAGKWTYTDSMTGEKQTMLFATTREARKKKAKIIRGAREEAEILYELNRHALEQTVKRIDAIHQKGEMRSLYSQGIYHLELKVEKEAQLVWKKAYLKLRIVSQSEVNR